MHEIPGVVRTKDGIARPRYHPIGEYGVIGDCRTAALVAPDGSIDWCCLPHFHSPAIFCRLLDADRGGFMQLAPAGAFSAAMSYMPGTNVLETIFDTSGARYHLVDFMPIRQRQPRAASRLAALLPSSPSEERNLGNDVAAAHRINRLLTCMEGEGSVDLTLNATFDYARRTPNIAMQSTSGNSAAAILQADGQFLVLLLRDASTKDNAIGDGMRLDVEGNVIHARVALHAGQRIAVVLNYARNQHEAAALLRQISHHNFDKDLEETMGYWRGWLAQCKYEGPYQEAVLRSALALKLCTFEPTGAIVAAPTTSLPEAIGGVRNWDYRYTWLRDSAFTLAALGRLGYHDEARDYFHFFHDLGVSDIDNLRIMYGITGASGAALVEEELGHLEGYMGSRPVRIGNGAATQRQMDVYGELLDAAFSYLRHAGAQHDQWWNTSTRDLRQMFEQVATYVARHWQETDCGIWEVRGEPRAFVYSRAMCWVALVRACELAGHHRHEHFKEVWAVQADAIRQEIMEKGYDTALGSFTQAYGSPVLDSANLRLPLVRFIEADDPRMLSSIAAMDARLAGPNGLLYRYLPVGTPPSEAITGDQHSIDGLPGSEGAFLACTYWLIGDLCRLGRLDEAHERFEALLHYASPLGLMSEEVDPHTGDLLGNYPQAFTHIGLINCAVALENARRRQARGTNTQEAAP